MVLLDELHTELRIIPIKDCVYIGVKRNISQEIEEAMENIQIHGILKPIIASPSGPDKKSNWDISWGWERVVASNNLEIEDIPAIVVYKYLSSAEKRATPILENLLKLGYQRKEKR